MGSSVGCIPVRPVKISISSFTKDPNLDVLPRSNPFINSAVATEIFKLECKVEWRNKEIFHSTDLHWSYADSSTYRTSTAIAGAGKFSLSNSGKVYEFTLGKEFIFSIPKPKNEAPVESGKKKTRKERKEEEKKLAAKYEIINALSEEEKMELHFTKHTVNAGKRVQIDRETGKIIEK
jgi:uncharacterized FlaG/YvyC family protein